MEQIERTRSCAVTGVIDLMFAYVGCFTTDERKSRGEGINVYRLNAAGGWKHVQLVSDLVNPSFLILNANHTTLYSVHADRAEVTAFAIEEGSGKLTLLNRQSIGATN